MKAYTGTVARNYERDRVKEAIWHMEQLYMRNLVSSWPRGASVLDVPVGSGRFLPIYREFGIEATGIDASPEMLAAARKKDERAALFTGNAEQINLPAKSVDYAVCWRLAHLVPPESLARIIPELMRVTRQRAIIQFFSLRRKKSALRSVLGPLVASLRGEPWAHIPNYEHETVDVERAICGAGANINRVELLPDRRYMPTVYVVACD